MSKLCLIYNTAPRYREAIFTALDREYDCDWYFGETKSDIKEMDISKLRFVKYYKSFGNPSKLYWQGALIPCLFNRNYQNYFILTETRSLSLWVFILLKSIFFPKKKVYGWSHGWYGRESKLQKFFDRLRLKAMNGQFVYNNRSKELMTSNGLPKNKIHVIYNSLDYATQIELRNKIGNSDIFRNHFNNNYPTLIFIGRLTVVKKLSMLLESMTILKEQGFPLNLCLVGDGTEKEHLQKQAENLDLEPNIWFYGACYDETKNAELVYNADLCVAPGNIGLTAMHTLMFGTPAISHSNFLKQMPEFEAIKPGVTGDFFEYEDIYSLADTIKNWLTKHPDRESVRQACYEEIDSRWNPENQISVIKKYIKV